MGHTTRLADERRSRLAAECLLEQMHSELSQANRKLSQHALKLSDEIIVKREEVATVRTEADALKGENRLVKEDLQRAETAVGIAERRLWDSVETIRDGFAIFDPDNVLIAANPAYLSVFDGMEAVGPGIRYETLSSRRALLTLTVSDQRSGPKRCALDGAKPRSLLLP